MPPTFEHLVVLMLENRSFDHMLGYLKSSIYPIDGLSGNETNPSSDGTHDIAVSPHALAAGDLNPDPGHDFEDVNVQLFGTRTTPSGDATPTMQGFVRNYATIDATQRHGSSIMKCFAPGSLPILATLATQYAICDRWFSSVPGPTSPNRMFAHAGWSLGLVEPEPDLYDLRTIFELFDTDLHGDYRIYHHGGFTLLLSIKHMIEDQHGFRDFNKFASDCARGDLPAYSFIEPRYANDKSSGSFFAANDQHPNHDVIEGDRLIRDVYTAIRRNEQLWHNTLLLILNDEHGGIYDHVPPPSIPPFDPKIPGFKFDRLGLRVPAVLVSPYIKPRTIVHTQFEHSSIIATLLKRFGKPGMSLGRSAQATPFDFDTIPHLDTPRTDRIVFPRHEQLERDPQPARSAAADAPPTELAMQMARGLHRTLARLRIPAPRAVATIATEQHASDFMRDAARMIADGGTNAPA